MKFRRVLVAPLDWGLGHATRCIPIIRLLQEEGCEIFLGGSGHSFELLKNEFPAMRCIELPAYNPSYPASGSMALSMVWQLPKFIKAIRKEKQVLQKIINDSSLDCVISDNRYGCWSHTTHSIFITHQLNILMPPGWGWARSIVNYFNAGQIKNFNACWVPDFPDKTLSGLLSENSRQHVKYIGPLSRFSSPFIREKKYDILILISGPEPQRGILENILMNEISKVKPGTRIRFVRGVKGDAVRKISEDIEIVDFLSTTELQKAMEESELIISRSGYSTIMDLAKLGKRALFIPTPGQTEQEYLAIRLEEKGIAYYVKQSKFDLNAALHETKKYSGFNGLDVNDDTLRKVIFELFETDLIKSISYSN